jgi:hypothetical protein
LTDTEARRLRCCTCKGVESRVCLLGILAGDPRTVRNKEEEEGRKGRVRRGFETRIGSAQSIIGLADCIL